MLSPWSLGHAPNAFDAPTEWVPARLPGAVQLDWAAAHRWPPHWHGSNPTQYRWMEDVWWTYRTTVPDFTPAPGEHLVLVCDGVDFHARLLLDGREISAHTGLLSRWETDLTADLKPGTTLEIRLSPAPKAPGAPDDRTQAVFTTKPAVAYGWDFHPRLIPLGLPAGARLERRPARHWRSTDAHAWLSDDLRTGHFAVDVSASGDADRLSWSLADPSGNSVAHGSASLERGVATLSSRLPDPLLWWPHDHGAQPLYSLELRLLDRAGFVVDSRIHRLGFRRVRLVMHPGAWDEPAGFPKSRSHPPISFEVNGRRLFIRGSNWVPADIFPSEITPERTLALLTLARGAHFNLIRVWGGGIAASSAFFDQCDELGLLVWQEFPLGCNPYPDDEAYLSLLDQESRALIRRARCHPSLALWCGGNELFNSWSGMTDQSLALRLLNRNTLDLDPHTPFIPTAPLDGMGHGDYRFRDDDGREVYEIFSSARCTAYSEFGCAGLAPLEVLREIIPAGELWPLRPGTAWETHHALNAWPVEATTWSMANTLAHYFGPAPDLETLVAQGQWLQGEGFKAIFEETRRQKPRNGLSLNWCFNEPWPTAANNSLVAWPVRPKPAYAAVAAACRPACLSARLERFQWKSGDVFVSEIWILNDLHRTWEPGRIRAYLELAGVRTEVLSWLHEPVAPDTHQRGPALRFTLPASTADRFTLHLEHEAHPDWTATYTLSLKNPNPTTTAPNTRPLNT
ncbi:glycoside hydrolase family 2 protein [Nibricoccus sp. IMCC34717]|uniref:glycoside hydrolase family 2 protein n=1 Tax=Nibricoccus sp. IMCC34717 TaxID=3034021 RepID=UPI00384F2586